MNNPFIFGGPVTPNDFFGRTDSIEFIMDRLYGRSRSSIAVWGDRRVGKSSLLHYLAQPKVRHQWVDNPGKNYMLFIDCQIFTGFSRHLFWQEVLEQIGDLVIDTSLPQQADELLDGDVISDRELRQLFRRMQRNGETMTLLLDEFGHLAWLANSEARQEVQALMAFLRTTITAVNPTSPHPRPLALVTSTRRPLDEVCRPTYGAGDAGSPFHNPFVFERLNPFELEDVLALLTARLDGTNILFTENEIMHLLAITGRHPILVQSYGSELFTAKQARGTEIADFGEINDFSEINEQFYGRNRQHFHDFWVYSSDGEQDLLGRLIRGTVDWGALSHSQEYARQQLVERGLLEEDNQLFSPIFADWLQANLSELEAETKSEGEQPDAIQLLGSIDAYFNDSELQELCFELGVDYDNLPGDGKRDKVRGLIERMRRYGRLEEMVALIAEKRPHLHL